MKTLDLTFVRLVQKREELRKRNAKAKAYSEYVARKTERKKRKTKENIATCLLGFAEFSTLVVILLYAFLV